MSYADLFQMASAVAVEVAGGPHIPLRYGRLDADCPEHCTPDGAPSSRQEKRPARGLSTPRLCDRVERRGAQVVFWGN